MKTRLSTNNNKNNTSLDYDIFEEEFYFENNPVSDDLLLQQSKDNNKKEIASLYHPILEIDLKEQEQLNKKAHDKKQNIFASIIFFIFDKAKKLIDSIDDIMNLFKNHKNSGQPQVLVKSAPLVIGLIGIIIHGAEAYHGLKTAIKALRNDKSRYRNAKIISGLSVGALCGGGLGLAIAYTASVIGAAVSGAIFFPIIMPFLLTLAFTAQLFKSSYRLHNIKKEKIEAKIAMDSVFDKYKEDAFIKKYNNRELLNLEFDKLKLHNLQLSEKISKLNFLSQEIAKIDSLLKTAFQAQRHSLIASRKKLIFEQQKILTLFLLANNKNKSAELDELIRNHDKLQELNIAPNKLDANKILSHCDSNTIRLQNKIHEYLIKPNEIDNAIRVLNQQFELKQQEIQNLRPKINEINEKKSVYLDLKQQQLKSERRTAYKTIEVVATAIVVASTILSTLAFLSVATFGIAPIVMLLVGVGVGFGIKIFEAIDNKKENSITNKIRHGFKSFGKKLSDLFKPKNDVTHINVKNNPVKQSTKDIHNKIPFAPGSRPVSSIPIKINESGLDEINNEYEFRFDNHFHERKDTHIPQREDYSLVRTFK